MAERTCPTCGGPWTVSPQTYIDARPGCTGVKSRAARAAVSYRRRLTGRSLRSPAPGPGRTGRGAPHQGDQRPASFSSGSAMPSGSPGHAGTVPGAGVPALIRAALTSAGVALGFLALYSAAAPVRWGAAIEVPLMVL